MTEFKTFTQDDWRTHRGATGVPLIARPDISHWGCGTKAVDIVVDAQAVCVTVAVDDFTDTALIYTKGGKDIASDEGPSEAMLKVAAKAAINAERCRNHLEFYGALFVAGFEGL